MMEKISNLFEDVLILITEGAFWIYVAALAFFCMVGLAAPIAAQALEWLRDGFASPRDGFWLLALAECGDKWCRPSFVVPTDWLGVNRIINWIMDLHVSLYVVVIGWLGYGLAIAWAERIGAWKAREARLRAAPPPPDVDDENI